MQVGRQIDQSRRVVLSLLLEASMSCFR